MKNIHVLPTDKPSKLLLDKEENRLLPLQDEPVFMEHQNLVENQNIYITSDEEIKEVDWMLFGKNNELSKATYDLDEIDLKFNKKIILTTDQDLIADGVQTIDDEFLEWFVKNPSCEEVKVEKEWVFIGEDKTIDNYLGSTIEYKIIIPREEPKTRVFGTKDDKQFWSDKPIQKGHPDYKETLEPKQETLEEVLGSSMCQFSVVENKLATLYRNQVKIYNSINRQQEKMYSEEEVYNLLYKLLPDKEELDNWFEQFKKK